MSTKIFYVEDELFLARIVKESLESRGFEVIMENNGSKAISAFRKSCADVCVLDIMLPGTDGFAIADEIRSLYKHIPIIFLSAKTETNDVIKGFSSGGNDYMRKPFSMEELIIRIQNLLKGSGPHPKKISEDTIKLGTYIFRVNRQILQKGEHEKKLSFRESELLKILYEYRDNIIHRKDILMLLWGNDSFFNSRSLDVYITKLRSYLKDDPDLEIITIKGIGYRFVGI
ncbi:MAG: response regulator transcription factor [Ginsengibacter sp.]